MNSFTKLVGENKQGDYSKAIKEALQCLDRFAHAFENENIEEMDACCHFPHYIISGNEVVVWETKGNIGRDFFQSLKELGFKRTEVLRREPIVVSENKIHFYYSYERKDQNENIMSTHENIWILTKFDDKWGIKLRSY